MAFFSTPEVLYHCSTPEGDRKYVRPGQQRNGRRIAHDGLR
jgi:hypothetical protein